MKTYLLKLTSAMVINGNIVRAGTHVELDDPTSRDFLRRGRAELVTEHTEPADDSIDLTKANEKTLLQIVADQGIDVPERATNKDIIALLQGELPADDDGEGNSDQSED